MPDFSIEVVNGSTGYQDMIVITAVNAQTAQSHAAHLGLVVGDVSPCNPRAARRGGFWIVAGNIVACVVTVGAAVFLYDRVSSDFDATVEKQQSELNRLSGAYAGLKHDNEVLKDDRAAVRNFERVESEIGR